MPHHDDLAGKHVGFFSWRDTTNPEGGGAEHYLDVVARGLVARGCKVSIFTAAHPDAPADEIRDGIRYVRRGHKMSVYPRAMLSLLQRELGDVDIVVDVQNGLPFFTRLVTTKPVVMLIHHVHREQWPVVYPGPTGKVGWFIESRLSPRLYRRSRYVTVSEATRRELTSLGVDNDRITVVHNGIDDVPEHTHGRSATPAIGVVGRLVPHKRVEQAIDAVVALRRSIPDLHLYVVGSGWWHDHLTSYAEQHGASDAVTFTGHVSETEKHSVYERCWVMALPSVKEGWGLVVTEAAMHGTPTVAYHSAGGTQESISDGVSGLLVDSEAELTEALRDVLTDEGLREKLSEGALRESQRYTWDRTQENFADVLRGALAGPGD